MSARPMKITKNQIRRIIREESKGLTKKYDDDSALRGDQDKLPDALQKGIIDKAVDDREEAEEEKKELQEHGMSNIAQEGDLLANLNSVTTSIEKIADELPGLVAPFGSSISPLGDKMARDLELQIEKLNVFFRKLELYFESYDNLDKHISERFIK